MAHIDIGSLKDIVASLMVWVASVSGYDMPADAPAVFFVSSDALQEKLRCDGCRFWGFYHSEERAIYVLEDLRRHDVCATLVHELVHHMQYSNKHQHFGDYSAAVRFALEEIEAEEIESLYIRQFPRPQRHCGRQSEDQLTAKKARGD